MQHYFNVLWIQKVISPFLIAITAAVGDHFVSSPRLNQLQRAVVDNWTHAIIGLETWYCISLCCSSKFRFTRDLLESFLCGILSSLIDVDHFIAANSLYLKDAVRLESRPFFHCTSVLLGLCGALLLASHMYGLPMLQRMSWLAAAAILSHHIRDATRRGLFMWPFGSTPPIPYATYICLSMVLPFVIAVLFSLTKDAELHKVAVLEV